MTAFILAVLASLFSTGFGNAYGPVIAPLDQAADRIVVGNVHPGSRVDVYANGFWIGAQQARGRIAYVRLVRPLVPGDQVVAVERAGAYTYPSGVPPTTVANDYPTYHYDSQRTGWNQSETALTQSNVASRFGQIFSTPVDGNVFAQPLVLTGVGVPGKGTHDLVYAATENDSVYALDATTGAVLWHQNYAAGQGYSPVGQPDVGCKFLAPVIGITGTPVIDRAAGTLYFDAMVKQTVGFAVTFHHFLHAVDVATGLDRVGSPVEIQASVNSPGGKVTFDPHWELQRPGLVLSNGIVYVAYGSFCDLHHSATHGWVLAYDAATLTQMAVFNASPGSTRGLASVWAAGYGIAADPNGAIYFATGNGDFDGNTAGVLWGDTVLKLSPSLGVLDYFTPHDQASLNMNDEDLGGGGPMLLPPQGGAFPNLVVEEGKQRTLYLLNRNHLGGYTPGGPDDVLQVLSGVVGKTTGVFGGPGYFVTPNGTPMVLYCGGQDHLKAFAVVTSPTIGLMLVDQTRKSFGGEGGTVPSVTSNGLVSGTAIVWAAERPHQPSETVRLLGFAGQQLTRKLVDLPAGAWVRNGTGGFFVVPTVINGHAYVGSVNAVTGFGLQ